MHARMKSGWRSIARVAVLLGTGAALACSQSSSTFQPVAAGARPWDPPAGWDPIPTCSTGYFIAIDTCPGCTGVSYALCDGSRFSQCVCGGSFSSGATCPNQVPCTSSDYPPQNWTEFADYSGPGWAGLQVHAGGGGASSGAGSSASSGDGG